MMVSTFVKTSFMVAAVATTGAVNLFLSAPAHAAGFKDSYSPANFTLTNNNADGFVNTSGAPDFISITGGDNGSGGTGLTSFVTTAAASGLVSFDWSYVTQELSSFFDPFGYVLNGNFFQLTDSDFGAQSGSASFTVALGDSFGFGVQTTDNIFGRSTTTISNFNAPEPQSQAIPTPALLPALLGMGVAALRKRKAEEVEELSEA